MRDWRDYVTIKATKPQSKTEYVKKTYTFKKRTADLIESHKYVTDGCEVEFVTEAIESYCADVEDHQCGGGQSIKSYGEYSFQDRS